MKDSQSLQRILKLMKEFQVFSSITINVEKCEASWIGGAKNRTSKLVKSKWTSKSCIKILGIHFSYNKAHAEKENFYNLSLDCRTLLNIWKQRWLSLAGKIHVFKSLVASKACICCRHDLSATKILRQSEIITHGDLSGMAKRLKLSIHLYLGNIGMVDLKICILTQKSCSLKFHGKESLRTKIFTLGKSWRITCSHKLGVKQFSMQIYPFQKNLDKE